MSSDKDAVQSSLLQPLLEFFQESYKLVSQCDKPSAEEYKTVARITGIGFIFLGLLGYAVKLIHIPVNGLLVGGS